MSDDDLIRRGDVREALRDVDAWTMANANAIHRLPAVSIQPMIDAAVRAERVRGVLPVGPQIDAAVAEALERAAGACIANASAIRASVEASPAIRKRLVLLERAKQSDTDAAAIRALIAQEGGE